MADDTPEKPKANAPRRLPGTVQDPTWVRLVRLRERIHVNHGSEPRKKRSLDHQIRPALTPWAGVSCHMHGNRSATGARCRKIISPAAWWGQDKQAGSTFWLFTLDSHVAAVLPHEGAAVKRRGRPQHGDSGSVSETLFASQMLITPADCRPLKTAAQHRFSRSPSIQSAACSMSTARCFGPKFSALDPGLLIMPRERSRLE